MQKLLQLMSITEVLHLLKSYQTLTQIPHLLKIVLVIKVNVYNPYVYYSGLNI